jgi:hypothetical protein
MKRFFPSFVIAVLFIIGNQSLAAQNKTAAGKLYHLELGGAGVGISANYDSRFTSNTRYGFGYRLGVGVIPPFGNYDSNFGYASDDNFKFFDSVKDMFIGVYQTFSRGNYTFPIGLNYVFGRPNMASVFEIGAGITYLSRKQALFYWDVKKPGHFVGHLSFMYRITPLNKGFSFRGGFTPMIGTSGDLFPMGGLSFGYAF